MKISKLFVSAAIAATIIVSACIVASAASGTTGDCTWTTNSSNTILTVSGTGAMADYTNGGAPWYSYKSSITSIVIDETVTHIGNYAFAHLASVTEVTVPTSVKSIGESAFFNCTGLVTVNYNPTKCESMGSASKPVFAKCAALTEINIGDNVKFIPEYAFEMCSAVTSVNVPESVYDIGGYAFAYCTSLESVTMSDKLTELPEYVFYNCTALTSVEIPALMSKIGNYAFYKCTSLGSITVPAVVTQIGYGAFEGCTNLHINTTSGSYAELVAKQYGISYTATGGTTGGSASSPELSVETNSSAAFYNGSLVLGVKFGQTLDGECVHIAFYNDANQVVNYYIVPVFGKMDNINFAIDADDIASATYAKVFIWDSLESCMPVSSPEVVNLK
ncbi:MAG: leucine-rich repeat protein [Clostridia bacterium]|nr:leucine-rich repeat protein [Clostridia bacterium]